MRIISQYGCYDAPYERVMLQRYKCKIYILNYNLAGVEKPISDPVAAEYSSEEKAIKVMDMCRKCYMLGDRIFMFPKDEIL